MIRYLRSLCRCLIYLFKIKLIKLYLIFASIISSKSTSNLSTTRRFLGRFCTRPAPSHRTDVIEISTQTVKVPSTVGGRFRAHSYSPQALTSPGSVKSLAGERQHQVVFAHQQSALLCLVSAPHIGHLYLCCIHSLSPYLPFIINLSLFADGGVVTTITFASPRQSCHGECAPSKQIVSLFSVICTITCSQKYLAACLWCCNYCYVNT